MPINIFEIDLSDLPDGPAPGSLDGALMPQLAERAFHLVGYRDPRAATGLLAATTVMIALTYGLPRRMILAGIAEEIDRQSQFISGPGPKQ